MSELNLLENLFNQGKINRREFIKRSSAIALAAGLSPSLFTHQAEAAVPVPKKGGLFRAGVCAFSTTDSLDPATLNDLGNMFINWQFRNNLVEVDHNGNAVPELAETIEPSSDAVTWTFKLRKGVEFHNGKTFDAQDVIYSINHHRGEKSKSGAKALMEQIDEIKADGKYVVIFKLKGGNADFAHILSDYHLSISPAGTSGPDWDKGIGTGGYIMKSFKPGVRTFASRNPNYWKQNRAHFDEVETINIADVNSRTNALKTGRIDWMPRCELKTVNLMKRVPGIQVLRAVSGFHLTMPMLMDVPPYDNNNVRLGLKHAIDRESLLKIVLRGYGRVGNDHPISPGQRFYAADLPQRTYDPDKARFYMKKAGMENHTFKLHTSTLNNYLDYALLFKEQATKAGINIDVVREPEDGYWSSVWLKKPLVSCHWAQRITEDMMFSTAYSGNAPWNDTRFHHEKFDKLLKQARAELDENKRREMYHECQQIVRDEGGAIVYLFKDFLEAANEKVGYSHLAGDLEADGCRAAERWWFKS